MLSTIETIIVILLTFALTAIILKKLIPILKSHKMGQKILDIGPRWHKGKEGTPTMGGLSFLISTTIVLLIILVINAIAFKDVNINYGKTILTFLMALANGIIGIIDDRAKLKKKANEGLTAKQKYLLQLVISIAYIVLMKVFGYISTSILIPFTSTEIDIGLFYYPIAILVITGIVNSANLTDGIDGLASSVTCIIGIFFLVLSFITSSLDMGLLSSLVIGGTLGFLVYNFYPARVFMGDTGSLFLGGLVVGCAFMMNNPLIILIAGLLYLCESASVIIQVSYFKLTKGKRFFKMAPIHHHFEKSGWSEIKIVIIFTLFTIITSVIALLSYLPKV